VTNTPGRRDQRRFDRKPAELPVTVRAAGNRVEGGIRLDTSDVSEGGAFLRSDLLFEVGEVLLLEIPLPSGQVVRAIGKVVRISRSRDKKTAPGMGIEFTRLATEDRRAIVTSLAQMNQIRLRSRSMGEHG
jgi:Tfp pilus assembly protein PilZ